MVMPGDNISMEIELIAPIAMDERLRFAIREGGRTVGAGVVASSQPHSRLPTAKDTIMGKRGLKALIVLPSSKTPPCCHPRVGSSLVFPG